MRSPAPPPTRSSPGWDPASWADHLPRLHAGDTSSLDVKSLAAAELLVPTFAGPWIPLPLLLDRLVVTHRLSAAELAGGFLEVDPDLSLLYEPVRDGVPLLGGGVVRQATIREVTRMGLPFDRRVALGPDGWLDGFADGELGAFFLDGGRFGVGTATVDPPVHRSRARRLRRMLQRMQEDARRRGTAVTDGAPFAAVTAFVERVLPYVDGAAATGIRRLLAWHARDDGHGDVAPASPAP